MRKSSYSLHPIEKDNLPYNWSLVPVGNVITESQYGTNTPSSTEGNTFLIGMKDINDGKVCTDNLVCVGLTDIERKKFLLKKGDILLNRTNSYDLVGKVGIYESDTEAVFASYLVRLKINSKTINSCYLNYWLNSYLAQKTIKRIATRAIGQANINPSEFKKHCYVPLPSKPEQEVIVALLSTWDSAIDKTERLIEAKKKQFAWLIKTLVNDQCHRWKHLRSEKIFESVSDRKNHPLEELLSVTQDRGVIPRHMLEGRVMSPGGSTASYKLIKKGDFSISLRSFQGGVEYSEYQGIISPAYTVLRNKIPINNDFYRHFFKSYIFIEKYLRIAVIGIRDGKQISMPDFKSVKLPYPPIEDQEKVATVLNAAQKEIGLLKQKLDLLKKQKRGLMQKLLTGQWRVKTGKEVRG